MSPRAPKAAAATPALTAFLRGVERRGAVFAELLSGSAEVGDDALGSTMQGFRQVAARAPFGDWPRRFWTLLLASPELRRRPPRPRWPAPFALLGDLGTGPRAALLLRLVAGLGESDAAGVLGVSRPTYRLALQRALPHGADGAPDLGAWHALGEAAQAEVRGLPPERLAHVARGREDALQGPRPASGDGVARPRWLRPALATVATTTVLALAATFVPRPAGDGTPAAITSEPLRAEPPASTFAADAALATHPDLDLLMDSADEPAAAEPGFFAWYAAQETPPPAADAAALAATPALAESVARPAAAPTPETTDAPR